MCRMIKNRFDIKPNWFAIALVIIASCGTLLMQVLAWDKMVSLQLPGELAEIPSELKSCGFDRNQYCYYTKKNEFRWNARILCNSISSNYPIKYLDKITIEGFGFPFAWLMSTYAEVRVHEASGIWYHYGTAAAADPGMYTKPLPPLDYEQREIPVIVWSSVFLNIAMFFAAFSVAVIVIGLLITVFRYIKHHCTSCGYPVASDRFCPECGVVSYLWTPFFHLVRSSAM